MSNQVTGEQVGTMGTDGGDTQGVGTNIMSIRAWARTRAVPWATARKAHAVGRLTPGAVTSVWDAEWAGSHPGWHPPGQGNGHDDVAARRPQHVAPGGGAARSVSEARYWAARARREELRLRRESGELEKRSVIDSTLHEQGMRMRDATLLALDRAALSLLHQSDLAVVRRLLRAAYRDALRVMDGACGDGQDESAAAASAEGAA